MGRFGASTVSPDDISGVETSWDRAIAQWFEPFPAGEAPRFAGGAPIPLTGWSRFGDYPHFDRLGRIEVALGGGGEVRRSDRL